MKLLQLLIGAALAIALVPVAHAQQDFPNRPVRIIVPFPPGALTDAMARLLATRLAETWKQPVVVENKAGASGMIGTEYVFRAPPDGYTLLFTPKEPLVLAKLRMSNLGFDPAALSPVSIVTRSTVVMLASPNVPAQTLPQLIAYAAANPGVLNYASPGTGSNAELASDLFGYLTKTKGTNVPYQGIAPATTALLAGQVDILFDAMGNALPNIRAGRLRALGIAAEKRNPALPDVPTVAEYVPGFSSSIWTGMAAPPKTPQPIVDKIAADIAQALKHPDFVARIASTSGLEAAGTSPAEMRQTMNEESERWAAVIRKTTRESE